MKILIPLCILFLSFSCASQSTPIDAPQLADRIWVVFQDSKDTYWFGSNGQGVFTYDGESLTQHTTIEGLVDNTIRGIQEDNLGNVYIETPTGISKYDGETFTTLKAVRSPDNQWSLSPEDLWFGYNANHVRRYDGETLFELKLPEQDIENKLRINLRHPDNLSDDPYVVFGIDKDKSGNVWFGTGTAGAFRYDGESFLWVGEPELSVRDDGTVPGVRSMLEDKDGNVWLSNVLNRYKIDSDKNTYEKLKGLTASWPTSSDSLAYFNSGMVDTSDNLWMTEYGGGVWKYDGETLSSYPVKHGDTAVLIITIYQDSKGVIWLGSDNLGVFRFDGENFQKFEPKT